MTQLKQGARFRCKIEGMPVEGKIQFENGRWYLCQNERIGSACNDKLGYKYSWLIDNGTPEDLKRYDVTDLELLPDKDEPVMGDEVEVSNDGENWYGTNDNRIYTGYYDSEYGYVFHVKSTNTLCFTKYIRKADPEKKLRDEAERKAEWKAREFCKEKGHDTVPAIIEAIRDYILKTEGK